MWMVSPKILCDKHLLGEHVELHMLVGCINKSKNLNGYMRRGLVDLHLIRRRHRELVEEMENRSFTHISILPDYWLQPTFMGSVDPKLSLNILKKRCLKCREAINHANL
jgi:hypothetical protein